MNLDHQQMCAIASSNARALEEIMLTTNCVIGLTQEEVYEVIDRCEQIIRCMREAEPAERPI